MRGSNSSAIGEFTLALAVAIGFVTRDASEEGRNFERNLAMQKMTPIATTVLLGATLALTGCKDKSETTIDAGKAVSTLFGKFTPGSKLEAVKVPAAAKRPEAQAQAGLSAMNLSESGSGALTWASRTGSDGNYTFTDVVMSPEDAQADMSIKTLSFTGLGMDGDITTFSSVKASGITITPDADSGEDVTMKVGEFTVIEPTAEFASAIAQTLAGTQDADDIFDDVNMGFAAMGLDDLNITAKDTDEAGSTITFDLAGMRAGKTDTEQMDNFAMRGLSIDGTAEGEVIKMNVASVDMLGLNYGVYAKAMDSMNTGPMGMAQLMAETNPYQQPVHTFDLRGLTANVSGVSVDMDSAAIRTETKGKMQIITQVTSPLTIAPTGAGEGAQALSEALSMIGYDSITLSSKGVTEIDEAADRMSVREATITMEDGFVLNMDYDIMGMGKMYAAQAKYAAMDAAGEDYDYMAAQQEGMQDLKIGKFGIVFKDNSFTNRVFAAVAEQRGTEPDVLKAQITGLMAMGSMMAQDESQQKLVADASKAITTFLNNPATLKVGLYPDAPIDMQTFEAMGGGDIDVEKLGIVIEASE